MKKLCRSCKSSSDFVLFKFKNLSKCEFCGFIYTNNFSDKKELYSSGHYKLINTSFFSFILYFIDNILLYLKLKPKRNEKVLDYGSGKGILLKTFQLFNKNIELYGFEPENNRMNFSKKFSKLKTITNNINDFNKISFNKIISIHVFEHIENLNNSLANINKILSSDGLLCIEVPNINSLSFNIAKENWAHLATDYHVNHFNSKSLNHLLEKNNFKIIDVQYFSFYHGTAGLTSAIMKLINIKGNFYEELKRKNIFYILLVILFFPFSFIIELIASIVKKGSIIRVYAKKI